MSFDNLKYAVISRLVYESDEVAQSISLYPRAVGDNHILLSVCLTKIDGFAAYIENLGFEIETEFVEGSGKVSLLSHAQVSELLAKYPTEEI